MNHSKISASLASALWDLNTRKKARLKVSIKTFTKPTLYELQYLRQLGDVQGISADRDMFSGELTLQQIDQLSERDWVSHLDLAQKLSTKTP